MKKRLYIISFIIISFLGTMLHFLYDLNNNIIFGVFGAVNESVWEHVKIATLPVYFCLILKYFFMYKKEKYNIYFSTLIEIITIFLTIVIVYYCYTWIFRKHIFFVDIMLFYFAIALSQLFGYFASKTKYLEKLEVFSKQICLIIGCIFILFTFVPPNISLFKDENTNTYGIFKNKY